MNEYPMIKILGPNEIEIMGFDYFDKIRKIQNTKDGLIYWKGEKYSIDTWQPFFVFNLYQNDEAFKVLTDYINQ